MDDEQRAREDLRDQFQLTERRCNMLLTELEELRAALEQSERGRKLAEGELSEATDRVSELTVSVHSLTAQRRKVESELATARAEYDDAVNDARNKDEMAKKAMTDVSDVLMYQLKKELTEQNTDLLIFINIDTKYEGSSEF